MYNVHLMRAFVYPLSNCTNLVSIFVVSGEDHEYLRREVGVVGGPYADVLWERNL